MDYTAAARDFIENKKQFHLGDIPTEQSNPLTRGLSGVIRENTAEGIKMLLSADREIARVAGECFASDEYRAMVRDIRRVMDEKRVFLLSSVGASGRLALQLDATWRRFWLSLVSKLPLRAAEWVDMAERSQSLMTGGDRACVRSVENFEDYMTFGARQIADAGVGKGDVVLALAECALSASIDGSAVEAAKRGCATYFLYCNPREILEEKLARARAVFERDDIAFLPLYVGNMAIAGSTRMQVTTVELLVAGAALEQAAQSWLDDNLSRDELDAIGARALTGSEYCAAFESLIKQLSGGDALEGMVGATEYEADTYTENGLITYCAHEYLQDIFTDTTERQPTFTLPPYRKSGDKTSPVSWAYAKDPLYPSRAAWQHILMRPIKGLDWTREDYIAMGAAQSIIDNPPEVGSDELEKYDIGYSDDASRYERHPARLICVDISGSSRDGSREWYEKSLPKFDGGICLRLGDIRERAPGDIAVPVNLPRTLMELPTHLLVKLAFNLLSTAAMAKMGRVWSNWMIQVLPTNNKLIDRSVRIIAQLADISYEKACEEFFKSYLGRAKNEEYRESYVVETLKRLGVKA